MAGLATTRAIGAEQCPLSAAKRHISDNWLSLSRTHSSYIYIFCSQSSNAITVDELQHERCLNVDRLRTTLSELHLVVQNAVQANRSRNRKSQSRGMLPKFSGGDFVLVAREDFSAGEKLALRWRGPRRVLMPFSDYVYTVEHLRNGLTDDTHGTCLKFYRNRSLETRLVMSHVLSYESGMPVARLMRLIDTADGFKVLIGWKGLPNSEDSAEPLVRVFEDVSQMLVRLVDRKTTPPDLAEKARQILALSNGGV